MNRNKFLLLSITFLFIITFISAQPPFQQNTNVGLQLEVPIIEYHKLNTSFDFYIHVHNSTSAIISSEDVTACFIHVYDPEGNHIIEGLMSTVVGNPFDLEYEAGGSNFTKLGQYGVYFSCQAQGEYGWTEHVFYVTVNGQAPITTGEALLIIFSLSSILLLGFIILVAGLLFEKEIVKIILLTISIITCLMGIMFNVVILDNLIETNLTALDGYSTFYTVVIYAIMVAFLAFIIFSILVAIKVYRVKRGYDD